MNNRRSEEVRAKAREAAQASRLRKNEYVKSLEENVNQAQVINTGLKQAYRSELLVRKHLIEEKKQLLLQRKAYLIKLIAEKDGLFSHSTNKPSEEIKDFNSDLAHSLTGSLK